MCRISWVVLSLIISSWTLPAHSQSQTPPFEASWEYVDASRMQTDEGVSVCLVVDKVVASSHQLLRRFDGHLCLSNDQDALRMLGVRAPRLEDDCRYTASGRIKAVLTNIAVLPVNEMEPERLEGRLARVITSTTTSALKSECSQSTSSNVHFGTIMDAIFQLLSTNPEYDEYLAANFERIDEKVGLASVDASHQIYLPPGSADTLVVYQESNHGTPYLSVIRFDGNTWVDVSSLTLRGYSNDYGSNYRLDDSNNFPVVRHVDSGKIANYNGEYFEIDNE